MEGKLKISQCLFNYDSAVAPPLLLFSLALPQLTYRSTTTDICTLLPNGYPRQSAAFVKIAGVRTNFTIPDVHNVALGGGSIIRQIPGRISVGPDSVGARLEAESMHWGGNIMTVSSRAYCIEDLD